MPAAHLRFRQIHLDFHTGPAIPDVGAEFDPEAYADTLARAHVNSVTTFARCHHGHLYYQSKLFPERIHPNLRRPNLLAEQIDACHARGIRVPLYVTVQWDQFTADRHRDWLCLDEQGREYGTPPLHPGFYRNLDVFHPGYRAWLQQHVAEILDLLPVDGFFFDITGDRFSYAKHWIEAMDAAGLDIGAEADRLGFARRVMDEWEAEMTAFIAQRNPEATIFYNAGHIGPRHRSCQPAFTHWELESLPSGGWGYLHFPQAMRYGRTLGYDCLGMTGKFHTSWGDFGSFKNLAALQFECFHMLALGARCGVGDQLHPSGRIDADTYHLIGKVYERVEQVEPWCAGAVPCRDVAVLTPEAFSLAGDRSSPAILGAVRMLAELRQQFDIIDPAADLSPYSLLILPDEIPVEAELAAKIAAFVAGGGKLLASFRSGAGLPALGVAIKGEAPFSPDFLVPGDDLGGDFEQASYVMYRRGMEVEVIDGGQVLAETQAPYFNRTWRTFCSHAHTPNSGRAVYPAAVGTDRSVYFAHPVFAMYADNAALWCKKLVAAAIARLLPQPLVRAEGPSSLIVALNQQPASGRSVLHALHYIPERRGQAFDVIEDVIPLFEVALSVKLAAEPSTVRIVPEGRELPFAWRDGRAEFVLPRLDGYAVIELA
jgi:hypothetical protein